LFLELKSIFSVFTFNKLNFLHFFKYIADVLFILNLGFFILVLQAKQNENEKLLPWQLAKNKK